jgi:hypothetical protein
MTDYPEDVFDRVIAVYVRGAFLACMASFVTAATLMADGGLRG